MPAIPKKTLTVQSRKSKNPPRILIDTNLFISGLLSGAASVASKRIEKLGDGHDYQLCLSRPIFHEYETVLHRFEHVAKHKRQKLLGKIRQHALWVRPTETLKVIVGDPSDDKFLECAVASQAEFIVTGDKLLLALGSFRKTRILTLGQFNKLSRS